MQNTKKERADSDFSSAESGFRTAKNALILIILRLLVPALSLALVVTISRIVGAEGLGRYTLAFTFLTIATALGSLGLGTVITRDGARDPKVLEEILPSALVLGGALAVLLTGATALLALTLGYDDATQSALLILSLSILPTTAGIYFDSAFVALERMGYIALATCIEHTIKVGLGVTLLISGFSLDTVFFCAVAGRLVSCAIQILFLKKAGVRLRISNIRMDAVNRLRKLAPTFLFMVIFAGIYWRIDVLMLSKLGSIDDVGYYSSAYRLYELAAIFPQTICLSLYPLISVAIHRDSNEVAVLGRAALRYLIAIGLLIATCTTILAEPILSLLFGQEFIESRITLTILIWTVLPYSLVRFQAYILVACELQRIDLRLNIWMSIINVALNSILIPLSGHAGAAFATLLSIIVYAILQRRFLQRHIPKHRPKIKLDARVLIASMIIGAGVWYFRDLNVVLLLLIASFVYFLFLVFSGFFSAAELKMLRLDRVLKKLRLRWIVEDKWRKKKITLP